MYKLLRFFTALLALSICTDTAAQQQRRSLQLRQAAVESALANAPSCQGLGDYYWEIGNSRRKLGSGSNDGAITENSEIPLASASKLLFAAYFLEKTNGALDSAAIAALTMHSGYDQLRNALCKNKQTINQCLNAGSNGMQTPSHIGAYSYDGGHAQQLASAFGIGDLEIPQLNADLQETLGRDFNFSYAMPQPAGGMQGSAVEYAKFLRKILNRRLVISDYLGSYRVCTLPDACAAAVSSPTNLDWHYSLHHWVESPQGDGAFSSSGAYGFYPWISADKTLYGILARDNHSGGAGTHSAECGAVMRQAWILGRY